MTLGQRLRSAIERSGMSIHQFHLQMEANEVPGSSYPNIHRYLADRGEPTLKFLRGAAELLEVRFAWLVAGEKNPSKRRKNLTETVQLRAAPERVTYWKAAAKSQEMTLSDFMRTAANDLARVCLISGHGAESLRDHLEEEGKQE